MPEEPLVIHVIGAPGDQAGADSELWHTLRLWRGMGLEVNVIPTWELDPAWVRRCERLGCRVHLVGGEDFLGDVPGLRGGLAVSFCNREFLRAAATLRAMDCRLVWAGCMCWLFAEELEHYSRHGPFDAYVFQSRYQQECLTPRLRLLGVRPRACHRIAGAFDPEDFPFAPRPHVPGGEFYIGTLARPDPDKFSKDFWKFYERVPYAQRRARVMGVNQQVAAKLGSTPPWAAVLPPGAETAQTFLSSLHALAPVSGGERENWPRIGLEAMACGVPIVAENRWGWAEMIQHEVTGFLWDTPEEMAYYLATLAYDDWLREAVATRARQQLTSVVADPADIGKCWRKLFEEVTCL